MKIKNSFERLFNQNNKFLFNLFLLFPTFFVLFMVAAQPLFKTFYLSLTNASLDNINNVSYVGLENYWFLFSDPLWWKSIINTLIFTITTVSIETILGFSIALYLKNNIKNKNFWFAVILIPWAIPTVVSTKIWEWMLHDQYGLVNDLLLKLHIVSEPISFLGHPTWSFFSILLVDIWKTTPFMVIIIFAGLTTIPKEYYEASKIDGASFWHDLFYITLPLVKPSLTIAVVFRALDALRVFDIIYIMQGNNQNTQSMSIYSRQQMIDFQEIALGSSASFTIFAMILIIILVYLKIVKFEFK